MQKEAPFISVLINNYNYQIYIEKAVQSVLDQTYQNFEIIIVDDGSTDNSADIIQNFTDTRIKTIIKENGGQGSAFNAGFESSKGEIIAFLDSDDWWKPNKLEEVLRWHNFLKGEYSLLQHNVDVWEDGLTYPYKTAMYSGNCFRHTIKTGQLGLFVGTSGLVFKRNILEKVMPVPTDFRISADAYLTRTTFTFGPVYSIPESLGYYRKHTNAVLGNKSHSHTKFHRKTLFPYLNRFYDAHGIDFQFKTRDEVCGVPNMGATTYLMKFLVRKKFDEITQKYPKIAIFGEGEHTMWLSKMLGKYKNDHIVVLLETDPTSRQSYFGQYAVDPRNWSADNVDAIVLSTNASQEILADRCRELYGNDIALIDLYADLPEW